MTCTQLTSAISRTPATPAARTNRIVKRWWYAYWDRRARQATVRILHSLDADTLRDIGVNPSEIESFVYGTRGDRVRCYDESWLWRCRP